MICMRDKICCTNVISLNSIFRYKQMEQYLQEFHLKTKEMSLHVKGNLFFALNNVPKDENMNMTFYVPVEEDNVVSTENIKFHSYFCVENMMSIRVWNDFETNVEMAYGELFSVMQQLNLRQVSPMFHVFDQVKGQPFVTIKVGIVEED